MNKEVRRSDYDGHPDSVASDKELLDYLSEIAADIGWIVIYFNSLEDQIAQCLRELMLRDAYQDERLDVFLAEMGYQQKSRALIHLYGQADGRGACQLPAGALIQLEKALSLAATIRNAYAHADWIGLREGAYIKVKTRSSRIGIIQRYKRIDAKNARLDFEFIASLRDRLEAVHELIEDQIYRRLDPSLPIPTLPELKLPPIGDGDEDQSDVLNALLALGFPENEAKLAIKRLPVGLDLSSSIKHALRKLKGDK